MGRPNPGLLRLTASVSAALLVPLMLAQPPAASADTVPRSPDPATVSTDPLPTAQLNGVAWAQVMIGDTVYVGGSFTRARPAGAAPGSAEVTRSNMLAYDVTTGALTGFAPAFNAQVRGLAVSSDRKTIYAVGSFTSVSGKAHSRIVALNAGTGAVVDAFKGSLNAAGVAVATYGSTVWVGGGFSTANGTTRTYAAGFTTTGALTGWQPKPDAPIQALTVSADGRSIVVGGHFSTMNGKVAKGSAKLDTSSGTTNQTWKVNATVQNNGVDSAVYSLTSDRTFVYGTGYAYSPKTSGRHLEGSFVANWSGGSVHWIEDCHGDTYSSAVSGGVVYVAGHPHYCGNVGGFPNTDPETFQRALAFSVNATGVLKTEPSAGYSNFGGQPSPTLLTWYPDINTGTYTGQSQGPWSTAANAQYVVYGGEFTKVNGKAQQGLVRFAVKSVAPDRDGPRLSGSSFVPTLTAAGGGAVQVSFLTNYDRDNQYLDYTLYRDGQIVATFTAGSRIWFDRPTLKWTNRGLVPGRSYRFSLSASDPFGNTATGNAVSVTVK